jgi:hypothetical protein
LQIEKKIAPMKPQLKYGLLFAVAITVFSCSTQKYIYDNSSFNRQKEIKNARSGNVFGEILIGSLSVVSSAICGGEVEWQPTEQQFKKLKLVNPTTDTVYVNMLTDIYWDKNNYCDFMDIRIPPKENCRILVPVNADYNVYFSKTPQNDDDEMLKINTHESTQLILKPGITLASESN